ncbi:uncharacterized protein LOC124169795 [Ischnura elegans]|uniref:uncharacterized protein LOC124169795 n=1 Tax=Ischnura elegans TaxID=197161 RepID=UPI001ED87A03|nr:uncharacterized protein LOC124169795 [Ischnura elegans]
MTELSTYLRKAADILYDYEWVYNFRATHILVNNILSHIPEVWIQAFLGLSDDDLTLLTNGIVKDSWPKCLAEFAYRCNELMLPQAGMESFSQNKGWDYIPAEIRKGMSPKKQHEVLHLTSFIYHQCCEGNLSRILDLGSGLGYLGKLLHHRSGYRVLGLEANIGCVGKAASMQQPICSSGVKHVALTLRPAHSEEEWRTTVDQVTSVLEDLGNWQGKCSCGSVPPESEATESVSQSEQDFAEPVCMVSLHSCGDLSPTALRLFLELPQATRLVVMSCCFHKMKTALPGGSRAEQGTTTVEDEAGDGEADVDVDDEVFPDFPMSSELKRVVGSRRSFLRRPLLRLASELTIEMWRLMTESQRCEHSLYVLGRAVFELYGMKEHYKLKKVRRRGARKTKRSNFEGYLEDALHRFKFVPLCTQPTCLSPGCSNFNSRGRSPTSEDHRISEEDSSRPFASSPTTLRSKATCSRRSKSFSRRHTNPCSPSHDIPFIDEDDCEGSRETVVSPDDDPGPCSPINAGAAPVGDVASPQTDPVCLDQTPLEVHRAKLKALMDEQCTPETVRLTTALYAMQACIQAIAEGLVIADRLAFLLERGGPTIEASLVRVFDRSLSPRSLAIVANKGRKQGSPSWEFGRQ